MLDITNSELERLAESQEKIAVSIYMPTDPAGDIKAERIIFKNLLDDARDNVITRNIRSSEADTMLGKASKLVDDIDFWQTRSRGLAVFIGPEYFRYFKLPCGFIEQITVSTRFSIKQILPLFASDGLYYLLSISQGRSQLFRCNRFDIEDISPTALPAGIEQTSRYNQPEKQQQFHTVGRPEPAVFHGHGMSKDYEEVEELEYLREVDRVIAGKIGGQKAPLVLAGLDKIQGIYRQVNSYPFLLEEGVNSNPDAVNPVELHDASWDIARRVFERGLQQAIDDFHTLAPRGLSSTRIEEIVIGAYDGRVDRLFAARNETIPGIFDREKRKVESRPDEEADLLDTACALTLLSEGSIYVLEKEDIPQKSRVAAIFRF